MRRRRSASCKRRSSILLDDGTKILMDSSIHSTGNTARFLEFTQRKIDTMNEATNLAHTRIQTWHTFDSKLKRDLELRERYLLM